jgi:Spy/CpxP family protein refolding chaperone
MDISKQAIAVSLAAALTCGAGIAHAGEYGGAGSCLHDGWLGGRHGGWNIEEIQDFRAARLERLKKNLALAPSQDAAWQAFRDAALASIDKWERPNPDDFAKLTTPERLEKRQEFARKMQERMAEHLAVVKTFYATLTPEQKQAFDAFHAPNRSKRKNGGDKMRK